MELRVFVFKFIHNTDKNVIFLYAFFFLKYGYNLKYVREGGDSVPWSAYSIFLNFYVIIIIIYFIFFLEKNVFSFFVVVVVVELLGFLFFVF